MAKAKARTNLKLLRVKHGLTQEEFAALIGCNRGTYSAIESGKRNARGMFWRAIERTFPAENIEELKKVDED